MENAKKEKVELLKLLENQSVLNIAGILTLVGIVLDITNVFSSNTSFSLLIKVLIIIFLSYSIISSILIRRNLKMKMKEMEGVAAQNEYLLHKKDELEKIINNGQKILENKANIYIDPDNKKYKFEFEKRYTIVIDTNPNFFNGQFYANKFLGKKNEAKKYYEKNKIMWDDLKFYAVLKYKGPNDKSFSEYKKLLVEPVTDNTNHIPYRIYYKTKDSDIPTLQNTEIILKYGYEVSAEFWGSYLNRTLSYFEEDASVTIEYPCGCDDSKKIDIRLSRLNAKRDYAPEELQNAIIKDELVGYCNRKHTIQLPKENCTFRVNWKTETIFETIRSTENLIDDLEVTNV